MYLYCEICSFVKTLLENQDFSIIKHSVDLRPVCRLDFVHSCAKEKSEPCCFSSLIVVVDEGWKHLIYKIKIKNSSQKLQDTSVRVYVFGVETFVHGTFVQRNLCQRRHLSKETLVLGISQKDWGLITLFFCQAQLSPNWLSQALFYISCSNQLTHPSPNIQTRLG